MSSEISTAFAKIRDESAFIASKADELARKSYRISKISKFSTLLFTVLSGLISLRNASEPDSSYSYSAMVLAFVASAIKVLDSIYAIERKGALMASISTQMGHINSDVKTFTMGSSNDGDTQLHRVITMFNQQIITMRSLIYHTDIIGHDSTATMSEEARAALRVEGIAVLSPSSPLPSSAVLPGKIEKAEIKEDKEHKTIAQLEIEIESLKKEKETK